MIRTNKTPFIKSKPSKELLISTLAITAITLIITFTNVSQLFDLAKLPLIYLSWILVLLIAYIFTIQIYKKMILKKNEEWL